MADEEKSSVATEAGNDGEERILFSWKSVERPFKLRSKEFYSTSVVLAVLVGIIFFFIEGLMPVLVIAAILFVVFVLSKVEPGEAEHRVTTRGIVTGGQKYLWSELVVFWLSKKWDREILHVLTTRTWPRQILLVLPGDKIEEIRKTMAKHLPYEEPPISWIDKMVAWFEKKIPLEE